EILRRDFQLLAQIGWIWHQASESLTVCRVPDAKLTAPVAANYSGSVMTRDGTHRNIGQRLEGSLLSAVLIPNLDQTVTATGDELAIAGELHGQRAAPVSAPALDLAAVLHLPEPNGGVFARRRERIGIGTPA